MPRFFFLCLLTAAMLPAQSVTVTSAVTTRQPVPNNSCAVPPSESRFLATDSAVWVVFSYSGGQAGDNGYVEWFDPAGSLYTTNSFQQTSTGGSYCYAYDIGIYGNPPAAAPGDWRVRLRWNNTEAFSRTFTIAAPPSSPLILVTDTLFPKATVGAPYSLTLQASGGTAPYRWSVASGTPPPGLSLSASGTLSGTPSSAGSFLMTVHLADSAPTPNTLDRDATLAVALPALNIGVGSLAFSYTQGGAAPAHQSVNLTSSGSPLNYSISAGSSWLVVSPRSGVTPGALDVSVNPQGLAPASYQDTVTVTSTSSSTPSQTFAVNLAILPAGTAVAGGLIRTVAGNDWTFRIPGGLGKNAPLGYVDGLTTDSTGGIYVADQDNELVVRWQTDGTASVVAGNGIDGLSGDGGAAVNASLSFPADVAMDRFGTLYIADSGNNRIRKVTPDGIITTIAGTGRQGFGGDNGPALTALLDTPTALAVDALGNLFLYDSGNYRIRKIGTDGTIRTVAGTGKPGYFGEGAALQVATDVAGQLAVDSKGNLYFTDLNGPYVRQLTAAGRTVLVAGNGKVGFSGDGGPALNAALQEPYGIAVDSGDNIYIADFNNDRIRKIVNGVINTIAGAGTLGSTGDGGPALKATFNPLALTVDSAGNVAIADLNSRSIRRIDTSGTINTAMGNHQYRAVTDGSLAANAFFQFPRGVALDGKGGLIIADTDAQKIRRVAPDGTITTFAGTGTNGCCDEGVAATAALLDNPRNPVADSAGNIYFADAGNQRIRKIGLDGRISTVAGAGSVFTGPAFDGDGGPAIKAHLNFPDAVALDRNGILYISDSSNHVIRRVAADGTISTYAGIGGRPGFSGDGGQATSATLNYPAELAFDASNNLYIADAYNHCIRKVTAGGLITTFAGNQRAGFSGDGGPANQASLYYPSSILFDTAGNAYILEEFGQRIRMVTPGGTISSVAGTGAFGFSGDGGPSVAAALRYPYGTMALDANGTLYFTDTYNHRVRTISLGQSQAPAITVAPGSLSINAVSGASPTTPIPVSLNASSFGLPVQLSMLTTGGGNWLQTDLATAATPATVNLRANPAGLPPGTYQGTVMVSSPFAKGAVATNVSFTVQGASAGKLQADPNLLTFNSVEGAAPASTQLSIRNAGSGSIGFVAGTSTSNGGSWLSISSSSGTVTAAAPGALTVTATPGSLSAGTYTGRITLTSPDTTDPAISIPVTLVIGKAVPVIVVSQVGLTFAKVQNGGNPLPQNITILNSGTGSMDWTATVKTLTGSNWLSLSRASGTVVRPSVDFSSVDVIVDGSSLAPGNYFGQIQVRATNANNSPQTVSVILNVLPPNSKLGPEVRPTGLVFIGTADSAPGSQTVQVANRGSGTLNFKSTRLNYGNVVWFTSVPTVGAVAANQPATLTVQPDLSARSPGVDRGVITLLFDDGSIQTVDILSVVPPPGTVLGAEGSRQGENLGGGCNPTQLAIQVTKPSTSSPRGTINQPVSLEAEVRDDCGNVVTDSGGAVVQVTFTTHEPAIRMKYVNNNRWSGNWQPASTSPTTMVATFTVFKASSNGSLLANQKDVSITLDSGAPVPVVSPGGVLNAASFASAPLVAPGGLISIYGSLLADAAAPFSTTPVPTQLSGAQVRLGDQLLPLFFSSNNQINAQVPFGLSVNATLQLVVQHGDTISVPADITVAQAQPAVFAINQQGTGQGAIVNGVTNVLADSGHPLHAGDVATIYCTGLGAVSPAVPEGVAASTTVLSRTTSPVTVTIGGQNATVAFAGLAPGFVGLYQVNAVVPSGLTAGDAVPVTLATSSQTSPPVTISVR